MGSPRIAVLGSANMDLTTATTALPAPGETVLGQSFATAQGGKGANQAIAAARSGARTVFLGAVGDDAFADVLITDMQDAGVDTGRLRRVAGPSGIAAITVDAQGENTIVVVAGANGTVDDVTDDEMAVIADADILLCQFEIPVSAVLAAATHAGANDTLVVLNPSPVREITDALLAVVDVLVVNESEARAIGDGTLERVPHVVTTLGASGAAYAGRHGSFRTPAPSVDAVDTTGAGDAFTGALAAEWFRGPRQALRWACAAGAFAATGHGAGASSGTRNQIAELMGS